MKRWKAPFYVDLFRINWTELNWTELGQVVAPCEKSIDNPMIQTTSIWMQIPWQTRAVGIPPPHWPIMGRSQSYHGLRSQNIKNPRYMFWRYHHPYQSLNAWDRSLKNCSWNTGLNVHSNIGHFLVTLTFGWHVYKLYGKDVEKVYQKRRRIVGKKYEGWSSPPNRARVTVNLKSHRKPYPLLCEHFAHLDYQEGSWF